MALPKYKRIIALLLILAPAMVCAADASLWKQYQQQIRLRQYTQAAQLLQPLAQRKDPRACYELAQLYRNGTGVRADPVHARQLLATAAQQGHADSQYLLGVFYSKGIGGERDLQQARSWLQQAAAQHQHRADRLLRELADVNADATLTADQVRSAAIRGDMVTLQAAVAARRFLDTTDTNGNHLLALAVVNGQSAAAAFLLRQGQNIDQQNRYGETALHRVADTRDTALARWLLSRGANPNIRNAAGKTPLHIAVEKDNGELVSALLGVHGDARIRDKDGESPLDKARIGKRAAALAAFQQAGIAPTPASSLQQRVAAARHSGEDVSPLQLAVERGDLPLVKALLKDTPDPWRNNAQGNTVITLAAGLKQPAVLNFLLEQSRGAGGVGTHGRNALFNAIAGGSKDNLDSLLAHGFDPLQQDEDKHSAMDFALDSGSPLSFRLLQAIPPKHWQPVWLPIAARQGLLDVTLALSRGGLNLNARDAQGRTALWYAAAQGQDKVVNALLLNKADLAITDDAGNTALHKAAAGVHPEVLKRLLPEAVRLKLINLANRDGSSPLQLAASTGRSAQVKLLLDSGAEPDQRDKNGNTALMLAVLGHDPASIRLLLSAGASSKKRNNNKQNALTMAQQLGYQDVVDLLNEAEEKSGVLSIFR